MLGAALTFKQPLWHHEDLYNASIYLNRVDKQKICPQKKQLVNIQNSGLEGLECQLAIGISNYLSPYLDSWKREEEWMIFLAELHEEYPQNLDIVALFAIASLGQAANAPNHISIDKADEIINQTRIILTNAVELDGGMPGILHALTHAYDSMDPGVAVRGILYGDQLAALFNYSAHAVHMVSHLYLAISNWSKVGEINERAYLASKSYCSAKGGSKTEILKCDKNDKYHAFEWIHYALLQQEPCSIDNLTSLAKLHEIEEIWNQEKNNVDYENWMFRMYARQTFKGLDCITRNLGNQAMETGIIY